MGGAVGLEVTDQAGASGTTTITVTVGTPVAEDPVPVIDTPTAPLNWSVGQNVPFSGQATDPQDGTLPAAALSWKLSIQHCATGGSCHEHVVQNWSGVASGSFVAPDHEYPSYLDLTLTATDSSGHVKSTTTKLDPRTVALTFTSSPSGRQLSVGGTAQTTPFTRTVIVGSNNSISALSPQPGPLGLKYRYTSWSDGGAQTHNIVAPASAATYQANYSSCLIC